MIIEYLKKQYRKCIRHFEIQKKKKSIQKIVDERILSSETIVFYWDFDKFRTINRKAIEENILHYIYRLYRLEGMRDEFSILDHEDAVRNWIFKLEMKDIARFKDKGKTSTISGRRILYSPGTGIKIRHVILMVGGGVHLQSPPIRQYGDFISTVMVDTLYDLIDVVESKTCLIDTLRSGDRIVTMTSIDRDTTPIQ